MKKIFFLILGLAVTTSALAVTPANPTNVKWFDCGNESGQSRLTFTLPTVDVDGNELDPELVGYRIYTDDDQIFTFRATDYPNDGLWGSTTDIYNYQWSTGSDIQGNVVYFYRTNAEGYTRFFNNRIGIQAFYMNDNFGIGGLSEIVYDELSQQVELPTPANPSVEEWWDCSGGYSSFMTSIAKDSDGDPVADDYTVEADFTGGEWTKLDPAKVSYSIFIDNDEIFVFTPEEYPNETGLSLPTTEIPFGYNGNQIYPAEVNFPNHSNMTEGMERFFNWRIGVRTNYRDGDQVSYSDIMYMEVFPQLKPAAEFTQTSFLADWSCDAENTSIINNFLGGGYDLYVINVETQDTIVITDVPYETTTGTWGETVALPGSTYLVENLTPGATYQYYVVVRTNIGTSYQSVVQEVTLPGGGHGYELGDVNHDGKVSIADVTDLINGLLNNAVPCEICGDLNGDERVTIADVTALINKLLASGAAR